MNFDQQQARRNRGRSRTPAARPDGILQSGHVGMLDKVPHQTSAVISREQGVQACVLEHMLMTFGAEQAWAMAGVLHADTLRARHEMVPLRRSIHSQARRGERHRAWHVHKSPHADSSAINLNYTLFHAWPGAGE